MGMLVNNFLRKIRFSKEKELIRKGMQFLVDGKSITIKEKIKTDYRPHKHLKWNKFQCYIGISTDGQRMYIQESDVMCSIRQTTKTGTHAFN